MVKTAKTRFNGLLAAVLTCTGAGCGQSVEHNPVFIGKWRSGLPVSAGVVSSDLANAERMNAQARESMREKNASGEQGVELDVRADGTFTMRVWMEIDSGLFDYVDSDNPRLRDLEQGQEHSVDGTWESVGKEIHLTSKQGFLPYAFTKTTRTALHTGPGGGGGLERSSQFLPLVLRGNGRLSQFPDENVQPGIHESGLDFQRVGE